MTVSGVLQNVSTVINTVVNIISENPVLSAFIGLSIVAFGALTFKKLLSSSD